MAMFTSASEAMSGAFVTDLQHAVLFFQQNGSFAGTEGNQSMGAIGSYWYRRMMDPALLRGSCL